MRQGNFITIGYTTVILFFYLIAYGSYLKLQKKSILFISAN